MYQERRHDVFVVLRVRLDLDGHLFRARQADQFSQRRMVVRLRMFEVFMTERA